MYFFPFFNFFKKTTWPWELSRQTSIGWSHEMIPQGPWMKLRGDFVAGIYDQSSCDVPKLSLEKTFSTLIIITSWDSPTPIISARIMRMKKKKKDPRSIWYPSTCHKRPLSPKIHVFTLKFGAHEHGAARNRRKPGEATEQWQPGSKKTRAEGVANSLFSRKKTQRVYFFFYSRNAFNPHTSSSRWLRNTILS